MRYLLTTITLIIWLSSFAQKYSFEIHGKLSSDIGSKYIILTSNEQVYRVAVNEDSSFIIKGESERIDNVEISTDSSAVEFLWVDTGIVKLSLHERAKTTPPLFKITYLRGSPDAELYYMLPGYILARTNCMIVPPGKKIDAVMHHFLADHPEIKVVNGAEAAQAYSDSIKRVCISHVIDSVLQMRPNSEAIVFMLYNASRLLGKDMTIKFYSRLNDAQKNNYYGKMILQYINSSKTATLIHKELLDYFLMGSNNNIATAKLICQSTKEHYCKLPCTF